jgi:hypothetical protein
MGSGNDLEIFYKNVRGLRTKSVDIFNNVCSLDYKIKCLTETWPNESFSNQIFSMKRILFIDLTEIAMANCVVGAF